jgi:hypothetical protein
MALSTVLGVRYVPGNTFEVPLDITFDASYPTGGYTINPASFGFQVLISLIDAYCSTLAGGAYGLSIVPVYTNGAGTPIASAQLILTVGSTGVQVANSANVSTVSVRLLGRGY